MIDARTYLLLSDDDCEDLIDGLEADAIVARIKAGEETRRSELVKELGETTSRVRTFRNYRGLTMKALADCADISQPHLSDIENGKKTGSVKVLKRIADALSVDLDDLVV